mmetsp:Transcript_9204/g.16722  ORF Transcript_9204/g.16722 Transcript_9204/m.16722 type:complete len:378 (-) Transcript_9204:1553-2686(-)
MSPPILIESRAMDHEKQSRPIPPRLLDSEIIPTSIDCVETEQRALGLPLGSTKTYGSSSNNSLSNASFQSMGSGVGRRSLNSIGSAASVNAGRRTLRRQTSRSAQNLDNVDGRTNNRSQGSLRKNHTFESVSSLRQRTSSGSFSRVSSSSTAHSRNSASNSKNFSWGSHGAVQVAQRSNGAAVKSAIDELQKIVEEATAMATALQGRKDVAEEAKDDDAKDDDVFQHHHSLAPPLQQCSLLAQWARVDVYYKVVITKYHGIPVIVRTMKAFPGHAELQESCCSALANLTSKVVVFQEGGVPAILEAMKAHSRCIRLQSSALEALSGLMPLIQNLDENSKQTLKEISTLVEQTKDMYLTENGRKAAENILELMGDQNA